ncbi:hypothetical protein Btru_057460 [Bulinus truncatus]|nr:hypothetical protein Btru_057460 [Bulinus truncatus]
MSMESIQERLRAEIEGYPGETIAEKLLNRELSDVKSVAFWKSVAGEFMWKTVRQEMAQWATLSSMLSFSGGKAKTRTGLTWSFKSDLTTWTPYGPRNTCKQFIFIYNHTVRLTSTDPSVVILRMASRERT